MIIFSTNIFFYREKIKHNLVVPFVNMENLNWVKILLTSVSGDKLYGFWEIDTTVAKKKWCTQDNMQVEWAWHMIPYDPHEWIRYTSFSKCRKTNFAMASLSMDKKYV